MYLGAAIVAGVGGSWLFLAQAWQGSAESDTDTAAAVAIAPQSISTARAASPAMSEPGIEASLRMARVAESAGMLLEPARYSAWTLYARVLESNPGHVQAQEGMQRVADALPH